MRPISKSTVITILILSSFASRSFPFASFPYLFLVSYVQGHLCFECRIRIFRCCPLKFEPSYSSRFLSFARDSHKNMTCFQIRIDAFLFNFCFCSSIAHFGTLRVLMNVGIFPRLSCIPLTECSITYHNSILCLTLYSLFVRFVSENEGTKMVLNLMNCMHYALNLFSCF